VPDDAGMTNVSTEQFERLMASRDPLAACQAAGDEWTSRGVDLVLRAPSVFVPEDLNVMLNPAHPRMREVAIRSSRRFRLDPRLSKTGR
jgi:RES domain-containing protein